MIKDKDLVVGMIYLCKWDNVPGCEFFTKFLGYHPTSKKTMWCNASGNQLYQYDYYSNHPFEPNTGTMHAIRLASYMTDEIYEWTPPVYPKPLPEPIRFLNRQ